MRNFSGIARSDAWHVCVELKRFESENFWDISLVISTVNCNDSVQLFFFFFVKDQIASFQLKQIVVFLLFLVCILITLFYLRDCDRV